MESKFLMVDQNHRGTITKLQFRNDSSNMNWVIDPSYLESLGYKDNDKLLGEFDIIVTGQKYRSIEQQPILSGDKTHSRAVFHIDGSLTITQDFDLINDALRWHFSINNNGAENVTIDSLGLWASLSYIMFRDKNVHQNVNQSAAVFPQISENYTKLAAIRRDNTAPNLGLYQTAGNVLSVGTFNEYTNRFFENVSPSLDGMLFHKIILAGGYEGDSRPHHDWIYPQNKITIGPNETKNWEFFLEPCKDKADFYQKALDHGHPRLSFEPTIYKGAKQVLTIQTANNQTLKSVAVRHQENGNMVVQDLTKKLENGQVSYQPLGLGEHQIILTFSDGTSDMGVFNVINSIRDMLRQRATYISEHSYSNKNGKIPYSFNPISNQGESIGKMTFVIQECLLDQKTANIARDIAQVEESAVKYVRPKWFVNGDFKNPQKLYGDFYRVMDLEYIAHLFYLLSKCPASLLKLKSPQEYLSWAAQVFDVRVNPKFHKSDRAKTESQMLGTYFLFIEDLLVDLKKQGLTKEYSEISVSWKSVTDRLANNSNSLEAAMTEHFFDNAGFGPATGALALSGNVDAAVTYSQLLKANIGFSNDFRSQNPDRWWEALSYMIHALWGGITAASAQITGEKMQDPELVEAAYRATSAILYMYDSNATTSDRMLAPGEAASTYSVAGPNLNRPDLSRNRFGQSIFASNGGIFSRLFPDGYTGEDDWDMGEELVAYLNGFGQKTYLYTNPQGQLTVINGQLKQLNQCQYQIQSFAPYISEYVNLDNLHICKVNQRTVVYNSVKKTFKSD